MDADLARAEGLAAGLQLGRQSSLGPVDVDLLDAIKGGIEGIARPPAVKRRMLGDAVVHHADASALTLGLEPGLARLRIPVRIRRNQVSEDQREVGHAPQG